MNFSQYLIALLVVQTVRCNTIGVRIAGDNARHEEEATSQSGVQEGGAYRENTQNEPRVLISTHDVTNDNFPSSDVMTSSDMLLRAVTSPKFSTTSLLRVKRGSKSARRKKCDPAVENCKRSRRRGRNGKNKIKKGGRKKCKKGKKGKKKRCKKTPKTPTSSPKPSPINVNSTKTFTSRRETCVRSTGCPEGYCCARHHGFRVCKEMKKEGDICTRPRRKNRRNVEHFEMCECESHLACKKKTGESRLYTCQLKT